MARHCMPLVCAFLADRMYSKPRGESLVRSIALRWSHCSTTCRRSSGTSENEISASALMKLLGLAYNTYSRATLPTPKIGASKAFWSIGSGFIAAC